MVSFELLDTYSETVINQNVITTIIQKIASDHHKELGVVTIIVGSDEWLLSYNTKYLNHDFFTDIITFDYTEGNIVSGDLLISYDRIIDNSSALNVSLEIEFRRVCYHGVLHLCGYKDKSPRELKLMREKEDYYLSLS